MYDLALIILYSELSWGNTVADNDYSQYRDAELETAYWSYKHRDVRVFRKLLRLIKRKTILENKGRDLRPTLLRRLEKLVNQNEEFCTAMSNIVKEIDRREQSSSLNGTAQYRISHQRSLDYMEKLEDTVRQTIKAMTSTENKQ